MPLKNGERSVIAPGPTAEEVACKMAAVVKKYTSGKPQSETAAGGWPLPPEGLPLPEESRGAASRPEDRRTEAQRLRDAGRAGSSKTEFKEYGTS